jgi:dTDP-4-amino-4,6-dideoxygalactose transaminase
MTGAQVLFVDIDPKTYTMDPVKLDQLLHAHQPKNIRAVIPVHLYGHPADMSTISKIAAGNNLKIIEDACQSHLARHKDIFVGNFGHAACFSFYPGKNLGAYGEAGGVLTNDENFTKKLRQLRDHGQSEKYKHEFWGHNYRMDGIQGAVLGVKLRYLGRWTARRREIAARYKEHLSGIGDLVMPFEAEDAFHVYHLFVVRTKRRSEMQRYLAEKEIATALHYPIPIHFQQAYKHLGYKKGDFPESETAADDCVSLPMYAEMTDDQVDYVISNVRNFFK